MIEQTIDGKILWSSKDVENIKNKILAKKDEVKKIKNNHYKNKNEIFQKIELLALKGLSKEKIDKETSEDFLRLNKLQERTKYIESGIKRLEKTLKKFNPIESSEWFIQISDGRYSLIPEKYRAVISKSFDENQLIIFLKVHNLYSDKTFVINSDNHSLLYTLLMLLKKRERMTPDKQLYVIKTFWELKTLIIL